MKMGSEPCSVTLPWLPATPTAARMAPTRPARRGSRIIALPSVRTSRSDVSDGLSDAAAAAVARGMKKT